MRQIDAGMGLSELTAFTAETWGCSRRQARDVVAAAHKDWLDACYGSAVIDTTSTTIGLENSDQLGTSQ